MADALYVCQDCGKARPLAAAEAARYREVLEQIAQTRRDPDAYRPAIQALMPEDMRYCPAHSLLGVECGCPPDTLASKGTEA